MKIKYAIWIHLCLLTGILAAQTPAGQCFYISLAEFNNDQTVRYFDCGNDNAFNTGDELTLEVWFNPRESNSNQKVLGKVDLGGGGSGYVLGVSQGRVYPEVWNTSHYDFEEGFIPPIGGFWMHLALTFKRGEKLIGYLNGEPIHDVNVSDNPLASNTSNFVIGIAPWDLANFQCWGQIDEVRVWNVARTEQEIKENLHKTLAGNENGLVAYYDFNQTDGSTLPDLSPNGLDGTLMNKTDSSWQESWAVMANSEANQMQSLVGVWNANNNFQNPHFAITENGLSAVSTIDGHDYLVFGHDGGNSSTTNDIPADAPANFERMGRTWYLNVVGSITADLSFDLEKGADGGTMLSTGQNTDHYTLLKRDATNGEFAAVQQGDTKNNNVITFNGVPVSNGYYTIGVGDAAFNISGITDAHELGISMFPNPADHSIRIRSDRGIYQKTTISLFNLLGEQVYRQSVPQSGGILDQKIGTSDLPSGIYHLQVKAGQQSVHKKIMVR